MTSDQDEHSSLLDGQQTPDGFQVPDRSTKRAYFFRSEENDDFQSLLSVKRPQKKRLCSAKCKKGFALSCFMVLLLVAIFVPLTYFVFVPRLIESAFEKSPPLTFYKLNFSRACTSATPDQICRPFSLDNHVVKLFLKASIDVTDGPELSFAPETFDLSYISLKHSHVVSETFLGRIFLESFAKQKNKPVSIILNTVLSKLSVEGVRELVLSGIRFLQNSNSGNGAIDKLGIEGWSAPTLLGVTFPRIHIKYSIPIKAVRKDIVESLNLKMESCYVGVMPCSFSHNSFALRTILNKTISVAISYTNPTVLAWNAGHVTFTVSYNSRPVLNVSIREFAIFLSETSEQRFKLLIQLEPMDMKHLMVIAWKWWQKQERLQINIMNVTFHGYQNEMKSDEMMWLTEILYELAIPLVLPPIKQILK